MAKINVQASGPGPVGHSGLLKYLGALVQVLQLLLSSGALALGKYTFSGPDGTSVTADVTE